MPTGRFAAPSDKTFSVQLYDPATLEAAGSAITSVTDSDVPTVYEFTTSETGIVLMVATATNVKAQHYFDLDNPDSSGTCPAFESYAAAAAAGSIVVVPLTGVVERSNTTTINLFTAETPTVAIACVDAEGEEVDISSLTLEIVIESQQGTDVTVIPDVDITKNGSTFSFIVPTPVTVNQRFWRWSLRNVANSAVLMQGVIEVAYSATADS